MRTLREAAEHLAAANTPAGRIAIARALGFDADALAVEPASGERLGLPADVVDVGLIRGRGALRALHLTFPTGHSLRARLAQLALSLGARTSNVLWLVVASASDGAEAGIACWTSSPRGPRVAALVVQRGRIVASDAEALCSLAACGDGDDLLVHTRWHELLGREAVSRRFYRTLEQRVHGLADSIEGPNPTDCADLALLHVSRLVFLSFLESKGWLNGDHAFLTRHFDACMASGGGFHRRVLLPLFFGTLNTRFGERAPAARQFGSIPFLNGGLFSRTPLERRHSRARCADAAFGALFGELLGAFRFTTRELQHRWAEPSIDPEMLGRAFESLMASRQRQVTGSFYTPQVLVSHVADRALLAGLEAPDLPSSVIRAAFDGCPLAEPAMEALRARLRHFTVIDPACGSGAFLVYMLERIAELHRTAGDVRATDILRREVLARCIHGVDVNSTAVWLCELRLWLSVVMESEVVRMCDVTPLPNLDCNIRVGDSLAGDAFDVPAAIVGPAIALARLRDRYVRASGPRKAPLRRALAREERQRAIAVIDRQLDAIAGARRERLLLRRSTDLFGDCAVPSALDLAEMRAQRLRAAALRRERKRIADHGALPFSFPSHFGSAHARGGFDVVVGNPPWVRVHNIPSATRAALKARYVVYRNAAWERGAQGAQASRGFAAQVDLASLFVERSMGIAAPRGIVALLVPAKLWRTLSGGGVRRLIGDRASLREAEDWSDAPSSFDAAVYPSVLLAERGAAKPSDVVVSVHRSSLVVTWQQSLDSLRLVPADPASPWLMLPPDARRAFDLISERGIPIGESPFARVTLGVKSGCNDAFMVERVGHDGDSASVVHKGRTGMIECSALRPLLRGEVIVPWRIPSSTASIVWTHDAAGEVLRILPGGVGRWLAPWKRQLVQRTDLRGSMAWWTLFRTEGADGARPRVVWSDFGRVPRAALLPPGDRTVPLNSCYVATCDDETDALTLIALLNSPIAAAWLNAIAEPARGGWHRYLSWTVSLLPIPRDWARARRILAPVAERAIAGAIPTPATLVAAVCGAYRLAHDDVAPLLAWTHAPSDS